MEHNTNPQHIVAVSALIKNQSNQFLLVKSQQRGWELPGGQVEEGEDLVSSLRREVEEEAGVKISIEKLGAIYSSVSNPSKVILDFIATYRGGDNKIATIDEILETHWFTAEEVVSNIQNEITKYRVQWLLENHNQPRFVSYSKNPFQILSETIFEQ